MPPEPGMTHPDFRIAHQALLQLSILIVTEILLNEASEEPSLNKAKHD